MPQAWPKAMPEAQAVAVAVPEAMPEAVAVPRCCRRSPGPQEVVMLVFRQFRQPVLPPEQQPVPQS